VAKTKTEKENVPVVTQEEITKLEGFTSIEEMMKWADTVIESGLLPDNITLPEQVITIVQHGKELGLSPHIALNNIHIIAGRPVISSAMLGAMLKKRNVEWTIPEDFVTVEKEDGDKDKRTTYEFYWKSKVDGSKMTAQFSMTYRQAEVAGYTSKQNWQKMPKEMLRARTLSAAVRALFPDVLMGMYSDIEMNDVADQLGYDTIDAVVTEDGDIKLELNSK